MKDEIKELWRRVFQGREDEWFEIIRGKQLQESISIINDVIYEYMGTENEYIAEEFVERIDEWHDLNFCPYCGESKVIDVGFCSNICKQRHQTHMLEERV